jgi:general secretion pathway protein A
LTPGTQEVLANLAYGIRDRKGIILLTGEVGTGKTMLLNMLLDWLHQSRAATAFVFNTNLSTNELLECLMADFGISCESRSKSEILIRLNRWLLDWYRSGQVAVLVVDEAQNLSPQVLEEIRFLTNLETSTEKLLQVVISGQPELEEKLNRPQLRQLRQRITVRCRTSQLTLEETKGYVTERLRIAGADGRAIFSQEAIESIYQHARGIPRVINVLCEHSLINSFAAQQELVTATYVEEVAREFGLDRVENGASPSSSQSSEESPSVEMVLRDLATLLDRLRQSTPVPMASGKGSYESYS